MPKLPKLGKIDESFFNEVIFHRLGAKRNEVVVGPQHGVGVGIIKIGKYALLKKDSRKRMVHTNEDPFWRAFYSALEEYTQMEG